MSPPHLILGCKYMLDLREGEVIVLLKNRLNSALFVLNTTLQVTLSGCRQPSLHESDFFLLPSIHGGIGMLSTYLPAIVQPILSFIPPKSLAMKRKKAQSHDRCNYVWKTLIKEWPSRSESLSLRYWDMDLRTNPDNAHSKKENDNADSYPGWISSSVWPSKSLSFFFILSQNIINTPASLIPSSAWWLPMQHPSPLGSSSRKMPLFMQLQLHELEQAAP